MSTVTHNSQVRQDIMRQVDEALVPIEEQIKALQEKRKEIKQRLKPFEIRVSHFNVMRQYARMEASARDPLFDVLREGFAALLPGTQASFLDALDRKTGVDTAHVAKGDTTDLERPAQDEGPTITHFEPGDSFERPAPVTDLKTERTKRKDKKGKRSTVAEEGLAAARAHLGIEDEPKPQTVGETLAASAADEELPMGDPVGDDDAPQETLGFERELLNA